MVIQEKKVYGFRSLLSLYSFIHSFANHTLKHIIGGGSIFSHPKNAHAPILTYIDSPRLFLPVVLRRPDLGHLRRRPLLDLRGQLDGLWGRDGRRRERHGLRARGRRSHVIDRRRSLGVVLSPPAPERCPDHGLCLRGRKLQDRRRRRGSPPTRSRTLPPAASTAAPPPFIVPFPFCRRPPTAGHLPRGVHHSADRLPDGGVASASAGRWRRWRPLTSFCSSCSATPSSQP